MNIKINNKILVYGTGIVILGIVIYYFIKKDKLEENNKKLKLINSNLNEYINKLHSEVNDIINDQPNLDESVKSELKKLIDNNQYLDDDIREELISAKVLMDVKQDSKAIFALVKIIENLFEKIFQNNEKFNWKFNRKQVLDNYIEYANEIKLIDKNEYHFLKGIKEIRNKEGHKSGIKLPKLLSASSVLLGLQLIFKLSKY